MYGTAQVTVDDDDGRYADNDALTLGGKYLFGDLSTVGAEVTSGDRGDAAQVNAEYRLSRRSIRVYGAYTYSTDTTQYDPLFNTKPQSGWTLGQRWRLSNQVNLFNESQYLKAPNESGLAHTFGMDFYPGEGWNLRLHAADRRTRQQRRPGRPQRGQRQRRPHLGRYAVAEQAGMAPRYRRRAARAVGHHQPPHCTRSTRASASPHASTTPRPTTSCRPRAGAKFIEGNVGFAWRPFDTTRWALLGKYTYLYDVSSLQQVGDNVAFYDQRSQVLSLEGVYNPDSHWEFAAKLMRREGEVRFGRLAAQWADAAATFAAGQVRYEFGDAVARAGRIPLARRERRRHAQGFLVGIDRDSARTSASASATTSPTSAMT